MASRRADSVGVGVGGGHEQPEQQREGVCGEDEAASGAWKVKLMCNYGGRIARRLGDGALRYVGGQTRLISVPRAASFGELLRKLLGHLL